MIGLHNHSLSPSISTLDRRIKYYFGFGLRPSSDLLSINSPLYSLGQRLLIQQLQKPVQYRSNFVASDLSHRFLSPFEIGLMFGLNASLRRNTMLECYPFPPLQILDAALQPLFITTTPRPITESQLQIPTPAIPTMTYIPALQSFLSLPWADVDVKVDVAAKSDDAATEFRHWNERITLVLPHVGPILSKFRRLLITRQFQVLYREFTTYLNTKYGNTWNRLLEEAQRLNRGGLFPCIPTQLNFLKT